jgi:2-polyprenyl-3-methyl-5-hydroxy-6-metoxy-1,4-benzoquinol methylase
VRYRQKALEQYEAHLAKMQPDLTRETELAARLYAHNIKPHLPAGPEAAIADLGCGFGLFLEYLRRAGYKNTVGVDICAANIRICNEQNFNVVQSDNHSFVRDRKEEFDCITLHHVVEHYYKDEALELLELVRESLKPGGVAIVVLPNMGNPLTAGRSRFIDITHEFCYTEESLTQIMNIAGFSQVSMHPIDPYCLPNPLMNLAGKTAGWCFRTAVRILYLLNAVRSTRIYSKHLMGIAVK